MNRHSLLSAFAALFFCITGFSEDSTPPPPTSQPSLVRFVAPRYSPVARRAGIQGDVHVRLHLRADCGVARVEIQDAHPLFHGDVTSALQQWQFRDCAETHDPAVTVRFQLMGENSNDWAGTRIEYEAGPAMTLRLVTVLGDSLIYDYIQKSKAAQGSLLDAKPSPSQHSLPGAKDGPSPGNQTSIRHASLPLNSHSLAVAIPEVGLARFVVPRYPPLARLAAITGDVHVGIRIDQQCVVSSLNFRDDGHQLLNQSVFRAMMDKDWLFSCDGQAHEFVLTVRFRLEGKPTNDWAPTEVEMNLPDLILIKTNPPDLTLFKDTILKDCKKSLEKEGLASATSNHPATDDDNSRNASIVHESAHLPH